MRSAAFRTIFPPTDVDVALMANVAASLGSGVSPSAARAGSQLARALKNGDEWSHFRRLSVNMTVNLAGLASPLVHALGTTLDVLNNFVEGDYSETLGLTSDGSSKWVNTGYAPASLTGGVSCYLRANANLSSATTVYYFLCCNNANNQNYGLGDNLGLGLATAIGQRAAFWGQAGGNTAASAAGNVGLLGLLQGARSGQFALNEYRNGVAVAFQGTTRTPGAIVATMGVFAANNNNATVGGYCAQGTYLTSWGIDDGLMSGPQITEYARLMQEHETRRGRSI